MEQVNTVPPSNSDLLFQMANMASIFIVAFFFIQVLSQIFLGYQIPIYVYALELALPAVVLIYHARKHHYFKSWIRSHDEICRTLGMTKESYFEEAFGDTDEQNLFEMKLKTKKDYSFELNGEKPNQLKGRFLSEAKELAEQAAHRLAITRYMMNDAKEFELHPKDMQLLREKLLDEDYVAANHVTLAGIDRKEKFEAEGKEIKQKAQALRCLPVLIQEFENNGFDPRKAKELIASARLARIRGRRRGVEDDVIAALEAGSIDEARSIVNKRKEA